MSVYARHFKGQGWGGRIHRRDPKGRDLWPGFWNSINLCFPNFMDRGRAGGSTERTQRGGRLQPLFRGTVPAKIYDGRIPSDSTAPASRDPSAFLWPVARPQGRPRLPAGLPGGWGRVGGGFGVRRVLGHSGGNTGHYDGSPFLWGVKCIQGAPLPLCGSL